MKKVLILDDRIERKKTHMSSSALQKLLECVNDNYLAIVSGEDVKKESISKYFADCFTSLAFFACFLRLIYRKQAIKLPG